MMSEEPKNLKHIKIEGFKSIKRLDLPLKSINILIGANGSGKSNLISLFSFLSYQSKGKLRRYIETHGGAERFFHFGTRVTPQITFDLKLGINGYHVEFVPNVDDDSLVFHEEYCTVDMSNRRWDLDSSKGESGLIQVTQSKVPSVEKFTKKYLNECRVYHFHDTSSQARFKKTNKLANDHFLESDAANIAAILWDLKNRTIQTFQQSYQKIVAAIQAAAPFFHDFYLEPTGGKGDENILLRWTHKNHDAPFSANALSDGTARFICLATLFLQPSEQRPATIILDEPELGLHPAALEVLADIIHSVAKETQVICSTQSVTFANFFDPDAFIVVDSEDGVSEYKRLDPEPLEQWLEEYGMGSIWAKNLIGGRPEW